MYPPSQGLGYLHTMGKMHRDIKVSYLFSLVLFSLNFKMTLVEPIRLCQQLSNHERTGGKETKRRGVGLQQRIDKNRLLK